MFIDKLSDLHMHLNGSFSIDFLERAAKRNRCEAVFHELKTLRESSQLINQDGEPTRKETVDFYWKQFSCIHTIIQTPEDIYEGTIDVIGESKASYLEIRTTPREMRGNSWEKYAEAFVSGLQEGNKHYKSIKLSKGLLSLDRTLHSETDSHSIIDYVVQEKNKHGLLVGIDVSGDPFRNRKLTGDVLIRVLKYALQKNIGVAIHLGEVKTSVEEDEVNKLLAFLSSWYEDKNKKDPNPFQGRVRLGHGIFLTDVQCNIIRRLQIPLEVCPTCHESVGWWNRLDIHPIKKNIYNSWADPIVIGTDDSFIFGGDAQQDAHEVLKIFDYPEGADRKEVYEHHAKFRFG